MIRLLLPTAADRFVIRNGFGISPLDEQPPEGMRWPLGRNPPSTGLAIIAGSVSKIAAAGIRSALDAVQTPGTALESQVGKDGAEQERHDIGNRCL